MQDTYDVLIVGATPAGSAAAIRAGQIGLRTLVVEGQSFPRPPGSLDWCGPAAIALCRRCGLNASAVGALEFTGLRLHSWDLKRSGRIADAKLRGWIVDRASFDEALCDAARRSGAQVICHAPTADASLAEECVVLRLANGRTLRGRMLLIADGLHSPTAALTRLALARDTESVIASAAAVLETRSSEIGLDVIIGARRAPRLGTILRARDRIRVTLTTGEPQPPPETQLGELLEQAQAAKIIPPGPVAQTTSSFVPAGTALDMDTHVGKHCVLVGEAGGFVSAFSHEAIYPCMRSGGLAVEVMARALKAPVPQDELSSFSSAWRGELADYLRLPNTDLALLIPLVFSNAQMSGRVARAFLLGQSF